MLGVNRGKPIPLRKESRLRIAAASEKALERISLAMVREDLTALPSFPLPDGYRLCTYRHAPPCRLVGLPRSFAGFCTLHVIGSRGYVRRKAVPYLVRWKRVV